MSVCVFGFQTNFLEFLPLLCVSPHVTSPAVAEAATAAAAAAPGIGLEQEPRSLPGSRRSRRSVPRRQRGAWTLDPGAAGGREAPEPRPGAAPRAPSKEPARGDNPRERRRPVPRTPRAMQRRPQRSSERR